MHCIQVKYSQGFYTLQTPSQLILYHNHCSDYKDTVRTAMKRGVTICISNDVNNTHDVEKFLNPCAPCHHKIQKKNTQ